MLIDPAHAHEFLQEYQRLLAAAIALSPPQEQAELMTLLANARSHMLATPGGEALGRPAAAGCRCGGGAAGLRAPALFYAPPCQPRTARATAAGVMNSCSSRPWASVRR